MQSSIFHQTPSINVLDNRGHTVRQIEYHRSPLAASAVDARITRRRYSGTGMLVQTADPRLHRTGIANFTCLYDLIGQPLRTQGVDAGVTIALGDIATRPVMSMTGIGVTDAGQDNLNDAVCHSLSYESAPLPGRLTAVSDNPTAERPKIAERFIYASNSQYEKDRNLAGIRVRHYDTAGMIQTSSAALTGTISCTGRKLLEQSDDESFLVDWRGEDPSLWDAMLDKVTISTCHLSDAMGSVLATLDSAGYQRGMANNVTGALTKRWVALNTQAPQVIIASIEYSPTGKPLREKHGNHVLVTYTYQSQTERLSAVRIERTGDTKKTLLYFFYHYDPIGNLLSTTNNTEAVHFSNNQRIEPRNTFQYDSLYQLTSASGREMADSGDHRRRMPLAMLSSPSTQTNYSQYNQQYSYDDGGNLYQIQHTTQKSSKNHTRKITVSHRSNRAVPIELANDATEVDALFRFSGHQKKLTPSRLLHWTSRGELQAATLKNGVHMEHYRYDGNRQRILKINRSHHNNTAHTQSTVYLPEMEVKQVITDGNVREHLDTLIFNNAGCASVRVLHWELGKPAEIVNDQFRWSYGNLNNSCELELDGEGNIISKEEYYPYGGTAILTARSQVEVNYRTVRFAGKERDATGLYHFEYRYYLPWTGRWISADPAGTIDGLNLFTMTKNNPTTFTDSMGLVTLNDNISNRRGDLIYGLHSERVKYMGGVIELIYTNHPSAPFVIMNQYTDRIADITEAATRKANPLLSRSELEKVIAPPTKLQELVENGRNHPLWKSYFSIQSTHKKFNINEIYQDVKDHPNKTPYHIWDTTSIAPKLLWKRSSKLGIEMAASDAGNKIHFVLDGLDYSAILSKQGYEGQSVTSSELRYVYRNRLRLNEKIHFYEKGEEVPAPWVSNPTQWKAYTPRVKPKTPIGRLMSRLKF